MMWLRSVLLALVVIAPSAQAYFFPVNPFMNILPPTVTAQVYNPYYEPMFCEGFAFGRTAQGFVLQGAFRDFVPAGQYRYVTVYVNNPYFDRFVHGWANIQCRFLR